MQKTVSLQEGWPEVCQGQTVVADLWLMILLRCNCLEANAGCHLEREEAHHGTCAAVQAGEESKQKSYEAICELPCEVTEAHLEILNTTVNVLLKQTTPTRVAHRRAMLVRERMVYSMLAKFRLGHPTQLILELQAQVTPLL